MNYICPVCNGFSNFNSHCKTCGLPLDDCGRIYDFYGDYSPYRPIDDSKLTNGYPDLKQHQCLHLGFCPNCQREQIIPLQERSEFK
ncbi:hypothetical protein [Brevibacillus fulvus]|uniref:Uncharacterized protein n=1 Tax=Brevibacillus fulvus TaxID=1125967 RepID=A0A939BW21_9BACL|nr:hypothetical protein [Brevibacillus fulvus]